MPLFSTDKFICKGIDAHQSAAVASLYQDNPDYWASITGSVPTAAMAGQDLVQSEEGKFPKLGIYDAQQTLIGVCLLGRDFLAPTVWLVEFFLMSFALRGSGASAEIFAGLEQWIRSQGGQWLRLGCVTSDQRAMRFWHKEGFTDLGLWQGRVLEMPVTLQLKWKSLLGGSLNDYFQAVPNDRIGYEA